MKPDHRVAIIILLLCACAPMVSVFLSVSYFFAAVFFSGLSIFLAPLAIHRITDAQLSLSMLVLLYLFSAYPVRKVLASEGLLTNGILVFSCFVILWLIGGGWRRGWQ
jgi:hypothetical protein